MVFTRSITTLELSTSIGIDPDQRYVALLSSSMFYMVSLLFLNICLSAMIDLRALRIVACTLRYLGHGNEVTRGSQQLLSKP